MIGRFDRFIPKQFDWETLPVQLPQLDFNILDSALNQQQQQIESTNLISQKIPNALQTEDDLLKQQEYKQMVQQGLDEVSSAYKDKGVNAGTKQYRDFVNKIKAAWQPGGIASVLENRFTGYQQARKNIDDYYKDEVNPAFKQFAYDNLLKQVNKGTGYNPVSGEFNTVQTPELFKNPNLRKAILESIKEIDETGDTKFLGDLNKDWWIQKVKTSGRPEDKIRIMTEALMSQPEFQNELQVEQWYQNRDGRKRAPDYLKNQEAQLNTFKEYNTNASKGKDVKSWQEFLQKQGYNVVIDGKYGDDTKKAADDFLEKQSQIIQQNATNPNLESNLQQKALQESYLNYALGFVNKKVDKDLTFNKAKQVQIESANARARTQALISGFDMLKPTPNTNVLVTPTVGVDIASTDKQLKTNKELAIQTEKQVNDSLTKNPNSVFNGWTLNNVAEAQRLFDAIPKGLTPEGRKKYFNQTLSNNTSYKFTPEQMENIYNALVTDPSIKQGFEQIAEAKENVEMLEKFNIDIAQQYLNTTEGKDAISKLRLASPDNLKNLSDQELVQQAFSNPDAFKGGPNYGIGQGKFAVERAAYNPVNLFKEAMKYDIDKQQKAGMQYKTENGYVVSFGDKDPFMKPSIDLINAAITNQSQFDFMSEGQAGLIFRDKNGGEYDGNQKPVITDGRIANGKYIATGYVGTGENKKQVSTVIDLTVGNPMYYEVKQGLEKSLAIASQNAAPHTVEGLTRALMALEGYDYGKAAAQKSSTYSGARPEALFIGNTANTTSAMGINTEYVDTKTYPTSRGDIKLHTYAAKTQSGQIKFLNVTDVFDKQGNVVKRAVVPNKNNQIYYDSPITIDMENKKNSVLSLTPVEAVRNKVPGGQTLNEQQTGALIQIIEGNQ